jgi:hypothetical protein
MDENKDESEKNRRDYSAEYGMELARKDAILYGTGYYVHGIGRIDPSRVKVPYSAEKEK